MLENVDWIVSVDNCSVHQSICKKKRESLHVKYILCCVHLSDLTQKTALFSAVRAGKFAPPHCFRSRGGLSTASAGCPTTDHAVQKEAAIAHLLTISPCIPTERIWISKVRIVQCTGQKPRGPHVRKNPPQEKEFFFYLE